MEKVFIAGYWSSRPVTITEASKIIYLFLKEIQSLGGIFSSFKQPAYSKKAAMQNSFEITESAIYKKLESSLKKGEIDEKGFSEIGFSIDLFNEIENSKSLNVCCHVGSNSKYFKNCCFVKIANGSLDDKTRNTIKSTIQHFFNPETILDK